jgi:hypothetical protein
MFGSAALDFAIGIIFIYLMISLALTALQEGLASLLRRRARTLAAGMNNLLRDPSLVARIYDHPLVKALYLSNRRPSYIPSRVFAMALLDCLTPKDAPPDADTVGAALGAQKDGVHQALRVLMVDAKGNYDRFVENVEVWFNHSMERVSGWYKRYTQAILMALAVPFTVLLNADSIDMACVLWKDPTVRASLVAEAQQVDTSPPPPPVEPEELADVIAQTNAYLEPLRSVRLPIGWTDSAMPITTVGCTPAERRPASFSLWIAAVERHWLGWLITVLAVSLGSPFWFDMLNKFMSVRGGGKAPEERQKSPREEPPALGAGETPEEARMLDAIRGRK